MNKSLFLPLLFSTLTSLLHGQFSPKDLQFFVGSGSDTTVLVVDFKDGTFDSSYAWGYIYSGSKTGEDMLNAIAAADENFILNIDTASFGNFLQDINYIEHEGLGGVPDYWSTWDGPVLDSLQTNGGIASNLIPGGFFGVSYTDFNPAIAPGTPLAAYDPAALQFQQVSNWYGTGNDSTLMIIDFADSAGGSSFVFGYLFNDSVSYLSLLSDLDQQDSQLTVTLSGAVTSLSYKAYSGMVSALSDWYVWEAENFGNWRLRYVDQIYLHPGDFGAVVYTRFLEPDRPDLPVNTQGGIGIKEPERLQANIYPNPTRGVLHLNGSDFKTIRIYTPDGQLIEKLEAANRLNLSHLDAGLYVLMAEDTQGRLFSTSIIKQ